MIDTVFDRRAVRLHRDRAAGRVARVAPVLAEVADRLLDRLDDTVRTFTRALDLGGRGVVAPMLRARGIETVSCELSAVMARLDAAVPADPEHLPFAPASFDLVVANLSLHLVNDLPGALVADCAALLQRAGFALPVADADSITLSYAEPLGLLRDLQAAGEANAVALRDRRIPPRTLFPAALARLPVQEGRVLATLKLAMMTGWAPSPSQPKPAARGSGQVSLEQALLPK